MVEAAARAFAALIEPPDLAPDDVTEIYLLRRHFGITADQYMNDVPAWEVDLLLDGLEQEHAQEAEAMRDIGG